MNKNDLEYSSDIISNPFVCTLNEDDARHGRREILQIADSLLKSDLDTYH